jgi:hypothetical protein
MIQATVLTDGSSDTVLLPILNWLLAETTPEAFDLRWADLRVLRSPPRGLQERIERAIELYPCGLLFIHRDAEKQPAELRYEEIRRENRSQVTFVCVVPVRMQEAWLLHDERSLREAADRPSGTEPLGLPALARVESLPDPKGVLHRALRTASGAKGRRAKQFNPARAAHRLADLIRDWSPLRQLRAFQRLESDVRTACVALGLRLRSDLSSRRGDELT